MFKKKPKNIAPSNNNGSFIRKPVKGWIHPDHLVESSSVIYETQYIGSIRVLESVKSIPFEQRGAVAREAISRCCIASKLYDFKKKKSVGDTTINNRLGDICLDHSGSLTSTTFSKSFIRTFILRTGVKILDHSVQCISFASIGENEYRTFVAYISKDRSIERACFVFDCKGDIADDIILTIGQAFELKYKEYLNSNTTIQPVLKRFTDPDTEEVEGASARSISIDLPTQNNAPSEYARLFSENNSSMIIKDAPGYGSLQRNDNEDGDTDGDMNFSPCPLYDGKEVNFGAIYDNPISSAGVMENIPLALADENNDVCSEDDDELYLEATPIAAQPMSPSHCENMDRTSNSHRSMNECWFHGKVSRSIAEKCIKSDGDFLVRESTSSEGQFVLSGMRDGVYRHILLVDPEGKVQTRDHTFKDVPELITFHYSQHVPIFSGNSEVYLTRVAPNSAV